MFQEERLLHILNHLQTHNVMTVHEICDKFDISRDTARRDILKLIEQGAAIRTHGGITLPVLKDAIATYRERVQFRAEEKNAIGKHAAAFLKENSHYFFDVSTTVNFLAQHTAVNTKVCTHSLDIAEILAKQGTGPVYVLGGMLNMENRFFFDHEAVNQLKRLRFDAAFFGAAAITEAGIYYSDKEDAYTKQIAAKRAKQVFLLADHQKFSRDSYYQGLGWDDIDVLITDRTPSDQFLDLIDRNDIELVVAN